MAVLATDSIELPRTVFTTVIDKVKGTSTVATLSPQEPAKFLENDALIFNPSAEAEVVSENEAKSAYDQTLTPVTGKKFTFQTTTRVSKQLKWADEDNQLEIITRIINDQAEACGRLLDYLVYHALNPLPQTTIDSITALSESAVQVTSSGDAVDDLDALVDAVVQDYSINGLAMSRTWASELRKVRVEATGQRLFPEIPLNLEVGNLDGIRAVVSNTVNGVRCPEDTGVLAFLGDFSVIRWGMIRNLSAEVIEYGDPDGAGDLKRYNQMAYRTEGALVFAILDTDAIACLKSE